MAKRNEPSALQNNRRRVQEALSALRSSALHHVLRSIRTVETDACRVSCIMPIQPKFGACAVIGLNVIRNQYSTAEWIYAIAHQLAHLSLNHHLIKDKHRSHDWIMAREYAADSLLNQLKIMYTLPDQFMLPDEFRNKGEESIYNELICRFDRARLYTLAGERDDIYLNERPKIRYDELFAKGIKESLNTAIESVIFEFEGAIKSENKSLALAKKWIMNNYPVFGALMSHLKIIVDRGICERMDISVGAVNPNLGEIYINPKWKLSEYEMIFLLMHEIMHVALMHGQRRQGREHEAWNFACFPPKTWVGGFGSYIEDVATMKRQFDGELIKVDAQCGAVKCTPDHPFYVRRRSNKGYPIKLGEPKWIEAKELQINDYVLVPKIKEKTFVKSIDLTSFMVKGNKTSPKRAVKTLPLNHDVAWLIGLYVAEGDSAYTVRLTLGPHETELANKAIKVFKSLGYSATKYLTKTRSLAVVAGTTIFGKWLKTNCGTNAHTKHIPNVILNHSDAHIRKAFLKGLMDGDGHIRKQTNSQTKTAILCSVSEALIADVALLLAQDGMGGSKGLMIRGPRKIGQNWTNKKLILHKFIWNPNGITRKTRVMNGKSISTYNCRYKVTDEGIWYRIRDLTKEKYVGPVYNMQTYNHTYIANSMLVHNCDFVINSWLLDMNAGIMPNIGGCYDPRLRGMKAEQIYDMIMADPKFRKGLRGFRGELGDIIYEGQAQKLYRGDVITIDDIVKRSLAAGLEIPGRGYLPAELIEEIKSLFTPPVPWDVELGRWMEQHVPIVREKRRTYARLSRRQSSTPDIPRPALHIPIEMKEACVFGVVLDTSISMDRELLGYALGAIASYSEAREVHAIRLISCDAKPYDHGFIEPTELRGMFTIKGRGGTALQPGISYLIDQKDFPSTAPIMIITDGYCESNLHVPREHCFVMPKGRYTDDKGKQRKTKVPLITTAPTFGILKE